MAVPFQKTININKERVAKQSSRLFLCCYQDNIETAMKSLTHTAFKVWVCLMFNRDGYTIDFSPAYVAQITGLCLDTARKAMKELIQKNYLIPTNDKETIYNFYETPQSKAKFERREIIDEYTGQIYNYTFEELKKIVGVFEARRIWQNNGGSIYD